MMVYSPYFDTKLKHYPNALVYVDLYGVPKDSELVQQHPEWLLTLPGRGKAFIPYDCLGGTCAQYAADVTSPEFRRYWIAEARRLLAKGYRGLWIDDVNTAFRVSDGSGEFTRPLKQGNDRPLSEEEWRAAIATFTEEIRSSLPDAELVHNVIWFAGPEDVRDQDEFIQRELKSADFVNLERGVNDRGITGGQGPWSIEAFLAYIDRIHSLGRHIIMDDLSTTAEEQLYALAALFLVNDGADRIGNQTMTPENWWSGYDLHLGKAKGQRHSWNSLLRRDFDEGIVLLNGPGSNAVVVPWPDGFVNLQGAADRTLRLKPKSAAILVHPAQHLSSRSSSDAGGIHH